MQGMAYPPRLLMLLLPLLLAVPGTVALDGWQEVRNAPSEQPEPHGDPHVWLIVQALGYMEERSTPASERVTAFYEARGFQPAWMSVEGQRAADVLLARMASAALDGLPHTYEAAWWRSRLAMPPDSPDQRAADDVELTAVMLRFAEELAHGVGGHAPVRDLDTVLVLQDVVDAPSARHALERLTPRHQEYAELRHALAHYRALAAAGGWPLVPEGLLLALPEEPDAERHDAPDLPGSAHEDAEDQEAAERRDAIAALCERLVRTGDLQAHEAVGRCGPDVPPVYDAVLEHAVRRFQARHGLLVDGIVGPQTIGALNTSAEDRVTQILVNMHRWRRLPDDLGRRHVFVNIPAFRLEAREEGRPVLSMRVVAGEPETATPVMRDEISYLEFSPYWNVPDSITRNTLLPRIAANPRHLTEQGYDVLRGWGETDIIDPSGIDWEAAVQGKFPYRLRQRPGPTNAMGLVKFMFPNDDAIYLHDTPADHRFEERRRAFSHGCVRVEEPAALAQFLLNDPRTWPRDAVERAMQDGTRQVVPLPEYVPVHLRYFTVWVEEGQVQFRADLYGLDAEEGRAIAASTEDDR
jgi:L,D-transpeptidase YcbB